MNPRPRLTLDVISIGLFALCVVLTALLAIAEPMLLWVLLHIVAVIGLALALLTRRLRHGIANYLTTTTFENSSLQLSLMNLPMPVLLLSDKTVVWYNEAFRSLLAGKDLLLQPLSRVISGVDLHQCSTPHGQSLENNGRRYTVYASQTQGREALTLLYLIDDTQLKYEAAEYRASRPAYLLIELDGYQELVANLLDSEKSRILEAVNRTMENYFARTTGFFRRISTTRYIAVVEERHMAEMVASRFDLLDKIRTLDEGVFITLSIGVGRGGKTLKECQDMAWQSLDMALGRGGDQVAVKTPDGFEFYGGISRSVEKRSRVKSRILATVLADLIKQADSVLIMGHKASDLDSVGAAVGALRICKTLEVPAAIVVRSETSLAGSLLRHVIHTRGNEDFIHPDDALTSITPRTLLLVVDTHVVNLLESQEVYAKCSNVAVIDHHRKAVGHIENTVFFCHEPYASSACELVSELLQYVPNATLEPVEAEALLAGIMLDTRNFALHTGVRTFEAAAYLRRAGASTEQVKLLFNSSIKEYTIKSALVENATLFMNCAVSVSGELPTVAAVAVPQAANDLLTIDGVDASFVAVQKGDNISISARSMGKINVQIVMEALGGGGHLTMAGTQLKNTSPQQAEQMLQAAIKNYWDSQQQEIQ